MEVLAKLKKFFRPVYTVTSDQTVDDAVNLMTAKNVNALIVTEEAQPVGIFTERDVFRSYQRNKKVTFSEIKLKSAMTNKLIVADPSERISAVATRMIKSDIRHLPIVEKKKIIGILTLNDLIEYQIDSLTDEIHHLNDYIDDLHDAGRE